jgi:hypothetical protein
VVAAAADAAVELVEDAVVFVQVAQLRQRRFGAVSQSRGGASTAGSLRCKLGSKLGKLTFVPSQATSWREVQSPKAADAAAPKPHCENPPALAARLQQGSAPSLELLLYRQVDRQTDGRGRRTDGQAGRQEVRALERRFSCTGNVATGLASMLTSHSLSVM